MNLVRFFEKYRKISCTGGCILFAMSIVWVFIILSAWDVRQVIFLGDYFNKLIVGDYWILSNYTSWIPISVEVSEGNLFPVHSFSGGTESSVRFFPYISLWLSGFLIYIFGISGTILIGSVLFPVLSYAIMTLIYKKYLPWRWAISLSALGILGFSLAPFRDFVAGLLMGKGWVELGVNQYPDILNFPFPSISLLSFLIVFFLTTKRSYMGKRKAVVLSLLWGLQVYVHVVNAIIGIPFWLVFFGMTIWRSNRNHWTAFQTKQILLQLVVILLICIPALITTLGQTNSVHEIGFLVGRNSTNLSIDSFFIAAYFILPIVTLIVTYWVFRVDPHELIFKFLPIGFIMIIELIIILLWWNFGVGIPEELLLTRLGLYFLHIFYFTPTIYFMHGNASSYRYGVESSTIATKIRTSISWLLKNASLVYLPIFAVLLTAFSISSSEKSFQYFQENTIPAHQDNSKIFNLLTTEVEPGGVLIGPNNMINISLMSDKEYGTLWTSRVISGIDINTIINRFALYARIIGWTENQYLTFMLPNRSFSKYSSKKINLFKKLADFKVASLYCHFTMGKWELFYSCVRCDTRKLVCWSNTSNAKYNGSF